MPGVIYAAPGATVEVTTQAPSGSSLGVRILDNAGGTAVARTTVGIAEFPSGSGFFQVSLTAPSTAGQYTVMWDLGGVLSPDTTDVVPLVVGYTAPSVAAPSSGDLCTVSEVKAADHTGLQNVGTELDSLIAQLITDASDVIMEWAGRRYTLDAAPSARLFHVAGGVVDVGDLSAAPTLVRALHPDGSLVAALTATDYRVEPLIRAATDPITAIRLLTGPAYPGGLLEVTGVWGWPQVPRRAARACVLTVVQWLRDGRALTPQSPDQIEPGGPPARMLPLAAREILQMDRRIGVA